MLLLDLNGEQNLGTKDPEIVRRFPPCDPSTAFLPSALLAQESDDLVLLAHSP
ncbi:hypothetical protein STIAU_5823 [Stigmatella aurantiaca DW4/3-1]|uniref:Uncharacterized protein n=1 Tax=Stigmatella aurantiaca (strain DW4/3-1) TaxID=378806 RepID=Q098Y6_STIAD|nr:hypothetical protein STIAU_5823 [Stigmatella aurantiaca DW4/3-1]